MTPKKKAAVKAKTKVVKSLGQREKQRIDALIEANKDSAHRIDKRKVSMTKGVDEATGTVGSTMVPTAKQLEKINEFTKVEATSENVVAFGTNAMNDLMDRDDEGFTTETVKEFASLPQPYSPIGKSYMVDHEYKMANAKGRIFDVSTKKIGGVQFLLPEVYIPNTTQYADFIEAIDFGVNNFVSVGVVIDKQDCSICKAPVYTSRMFGWAWCDNGHEKGFYYVPGEEEDDGWGYYLPVDPDTKGAVRAQVKLSDPIDFYELSQVFLGAQFYAELAKKPEFKGLVKAATKNVPVLGLSEKDVESVEIKMPHEPKEISEARSKFAVSFDKDLESYRWTDDKGLLWSYDISDAEVRCLGKAADLDDEDDDTEAEKKAKGGGDPSEIKDADEDEEDEESEEEEENDDDSEDEEEQDEEENDDEEDDETKSPTGTVLLRAAKVAKLPNDILEAWAGSDDDSLESLLSLCAKQIRKSRKDINTLTAKAAVGDQYLADAQADAIHWYTMANRDPKDPTKGVKVELAQKLIERCGDDIDLVKELATDWKATAQKLFPQAVRRSSVEGDPNTAEPAADIPAELSENKDSQEGSVIVRRIHG